MTLPQHRLQRTTLIGIVSVGILVCIAGCHGPAGGSEGSESAARTHLEAELKKWIGGGETDAATLDGKLGGSLPISYTIKSIVPGEPDPLALFDDAPPPEDWRTYPAYRANVVVEFKSQAGTPLEKVATYTLTWNKAKKKWHITEQLSR